SPSPETWTSRDRSRNPSATCYWVRSRTSLLRSLRNLPELFSVVDRACDFRPAANEDFIFRMGQDLKPRTPQHRFKTRAVRNPPIRRIVGKSLFDKVHARKLLVVKHFVFPKRKVCWNFRGLFRTPQHRLRHELTGDNVCV